MRNFDFVAKYASSQAPSCTNFLPPGSASDSRTGLLHPTLFSAHFSTERTTIIVLLVNVLCLDNRQRASAVLREVVGVKGLPWVLVQLMLLVLLLLLVLLQLQES